MDLVMNPYHYLGKLLLVALLVSESNSEHTSELNGFEGREFTFTCPEGNEPHFWYKGNGTEGERIGVAHRDLGRVECSLPGCTILGSGDLKIPSLALDDERWYTCKKSGDLNDFIFPDYQHYVKVNVNVEASKETVDMKEIKFSVDGQPFDIECTVDRIKPRPEISFKILGSSETFKPDDEVVESLGDGTLRIIARIQKTFQRSDDGNKFRCIVEPPPGRGIKIVKDRRVYVDWEYSTSVRELDPNEIPVIGSQKTLECVVKDEGKPRAESAHWLLNGRTIRDSAKYSGLSSLRLTIKDLLKTDIGEYRCGINNRAGPGISVEGYDLMVWYTYSSIVMVPKQDEIPLIGSDIHLACNPTVRGYPTEVLGVNWYRGGEMISESDKYERITIYELKVKNLEKYADNGDYTCIIVNAAGGGHSSRRYSLEALWGPSGQPIVEPAEITTAIGSDLILNCGGDFDQGNPNIHYTIWSNNIDETFYRNVTGTSLILENVQTVRAAGHYQCQAGNLYGKTVLSTPNTVTVEAPLEIEDPTSPLLKTLVWIDEYFELSCTISGSNIAQYTWKKDGQALDKQFFDYLPLEKVGNSSFLYGQRQAQRSVIKRKIQGYHFTCENVEYFNGDYSCHPQGSMAGQPTTAVSQPITVTTQYKAFWAGQDYLVSAAAGDRSISIFCDVCSNPKVASFEWTFEGSPLRYNIQDLGATITLDEVKLEDFGIYMCSTVTIINGLQYTSEFDIKLEERGPPYPPRDFRVTSRTSTSVNLTWTPGHAAGYGPLTFDLELKNAAAVGYKVIQSDISENEIFLDKLFHFTEYSVRIQAFNQRPEEKGPNYSDQVPLSFRTRMVPNISMYSAVVNETEMTISWNYVPSTQKDWSNEEDYKVEVLIEYKEQNKHHFETFPANGSLLSATLGNVTIPGEYDIYSGYEIRLLTYENGITDLMSKPEPFSTLPKQKDDNSPLLLLVLKVVLPILVIGAICVGITSICYFRRRSNRRRKQIHLKLAPARHELDNISPITSDTNRNESDTNRNECDWQVGYEVPVDCTEDPDQPQPVYEEIPEDAHQMTVSLNDETNELDNMGPSTSDTDRSESDWQVRYEVPVGCTEDPNQQVVYEEIPEDVHQMNASWNDSNDNSMDSDKEQMYEDVLDAARPLMPSVLNDISEYVRVQVEETLTDPNDLKLDPDPIGSGHYGEVYKGSLNVDGKQLKVAVKKAKNLGTKQEKDDFFKEGAIMRKICHMNVLPLLCIVIKDNVPHVVTPFAENGDLRKFIARKHKSLTRLDMLHFGLDIARGMECLERNHIVHRDLACRNCLVDGNYRILVTDFGLARDIYQSNVYQAKNNRELPIFWMAIETINPNNRECVYTTKSDVWAYGVTLWEIFTKGSRPYVGIIDLWRFLRQGSRLPTPSDAPTEVVELMQHCWRANPKERPKFSDIVKVLEDLIQKIGVEASGGVLTSSV